MRHLIIVEDIRNLIIRFVTLQNIKFILLMKYMLSNQAFNAFENTWGTTFMYDFHISYYREIKIIPTILSRCQIYDFNRIEIEDIVDQLKITRRRYQFQGWCLPNRSGVRCLTRCVVYVWFNCHLFVKQKHYLSKYDYQFAYSWSWLLFQAFGFIFRSRYVCHFIVEWYQKFDHIIFWLV